MAKPKRMSELFASPMEGDENISVGEATPPYSSDGPTLPVIGPANDHSIEVSDPDTTGITKLPRAGQKRRAKNQTRPVLNKRAHSQSTPSINAALYHPWTLLPSELLKLVESQSRIRKTQNVIPVVFSKNQNVKSGINRLKTYLGVYRDPASTIELPDALKLDDCVIAVSAQGEGTTKLIGIVDMARRFVAPGRDVKKSNERTEQWWMYIMLTSIETEQKHVPRNKQMQKGQKGSSTLPQLPDPTVETPTSKRSDSQASQEESNLEAFHMRKVPVLTIWMTRRQILAFKHAFGEHSFTTQGIPRQDELIR